MYSRGEERALRSGVAGRADRDHDFERARSAFSEAAGAIDNGDISVPTRRLEVIPERARGGLHLRGASRVVATNGDVQRVATCSGVAADPIDDVFRSSTLWTASPKR